MKLKELLKGRDKLRKYDELKNLIELIKGCQSRYGKDCDMSIPVSPYVQQIVLAALDAELAEMETKEREAYRKDNDMNEFDKRAEAYMRTVMNNDGDVFTRADLYEYIMDAWKAGYAEVGFDLSLLSGESLSKAQNQKSQPIN